MASASRLSTRLSNSVPPARLAALRSGYAQSVSARRRSQALFAVLLLLGVGLSAWVGEVDLANAWKNLAKFPAYIAGTAPTLHAATLGADLAEWYWGLGRWLRLLWETLLIAYVGTVVGALGAFVLCFAASANLVSSAPLVFVTRRLLEFGRTVPEIVFALIFVVAFGLGPLPGVMAIVIHTIGALGKLFAEVVENIDLDPVDGVRATGANRLQVVRHAVLPQVQSNFVSYALLRFEVNVRSAAIMGFVGAGGIGQELLEAIRKFYYTDVSAILLLIIGCVMLIDIGTERLRHRLADVEALR